MNCIDRENMLEKKVSKGKKEQYGKLHYNNVDRKKRLNECIEWKERLLKKSREGH